MTSLKSALLGATIILSAGAFTAAKAADIEQRGGMKDEPGYMPAITWSGMYLGAHVGASLDDTVNLSEIGFESNFDIGDTTLVGLHIGYNWQATTNIVLGVEGDYTVSGSDDFGGFGTDYIASVRARLGYAYGKNLVYATGGVAFLGWEDGFGEFLGFDKSVTGWVAGVGIERKIANNLSLGLEGLSYAFDDSGSLSFPDGEGEPTNSITSDYERNFWTVRARLNYHFSGGYDEALK